jgi:hypothetical protein
LIKKVRDHDIKEERYNNDLIEFNKKSFYDLIANNTNTKNIKRKCPTMMSPDETNTGDKWKNDVPK